MKNELKEECIKRLEILQKNFGQHPNCLKEFKKDNTLYYAERTMLGGVLYWVENRQDLIERVRKFEEENNGNVKVYYCLLTQTQFGELFDMLYVSNGEDNKTYWEEERNDLKKGFAFSNCINLTDEIMSDFGDIQITGRGGGIIRIG